MAYGKNEGESYKELKELMDEWIAENPLALVFDEAAEHYPEMAPEDASFIESIRSYYDKMGMCTPKQIYRLKKICEKYELLGLMS